MFRFTREPSSGSQSQCLAKITGMVPAYLLICFVASAMAAYSNLYTVCVARTDFIILMCFNNHIIYILNALVG